LTPVVWSLPPWTRCPQPLFRARDSMAKHRMTGSTSLTPMYATTATQALPASGISANQPDQPGRSSADSRSVPRKGSERRPRTHVLTGLRHSLGGWVAIQSAMHGPKPRSSHSTGKVQDYWVESSPSSRAISSMSSGTPGSVRASSTLRSSRRLRSGSAWIACQYHARRALAEVVSGSLIAWPRTCGAPRHPGGPSARAGG
jgi:hypothetical protein